MKNRLKNTALTYGLKFLFVAVMLLLAFFLAEEQMKGLYFIVFFMFFVLAFLPLLTYLQEKVDSIISPIGYGELYIQAVDSILNIESFDEMLKGTFDRILDLMSIPAGLLIFYYHDRDEFSIFYQKNKVKKVIRKARIESDNILLRVINGPDDIIIRSRLSASINFEKNIMEEMDKLSGEIVVPVYYHDMFLGLIVMGGRKRKFSNREIRLIKVFASKIAIQSINSFFFNEILKKKELEKEYELASRVQKKFLPDADIQVGRIVVRTHHETASLMTREFYDIFINDAVEDDVRVSAYRIRGTIAGTSIQMPGIQALLQSFARLGLSPSRSVSRLKSITEKNLLEGRLSLFHSSFRQSGHVSYCSEGYPPPLVFKKSLKLLHPLKIKGKGKPESLKLEPGDILIVSCEPYFAEITENIARFTEILTGHDPAPLGRIRSHFVKALGARDEGEEKDKLLILVAMEEVA